MESVAVVAPPHVGQPLDLAPFRALRLSPSRIGTPTAVRLVSRPYRTASSRFRAWQKRGLITQDPLPSLYVHEYTVGGTTVRGLVGALDVSRRALRPEDRAVLPHEGVHPPQADALAERMADMTLNPAPILLTQHSPAALRCLLAEVRTALPGRQFVDRDGSTHRVWAITDPERQQEVRALLAGTTGLIADGHHRYAAYLRLQARHPGGAHDHGLAMLVDQLDTPLTLGAIHRLLLGTSVEDVVAAAGACSLPTTELSTDRARRVVPDGDHLVVTDGVRWVSVDIAARGPRTAVDLLHDQVVPSVAHGPRRVTYHHDVEQVLAKAAPGVATAVLLPAPTVEEIERAVLAGRLFPEKATSFQPKPPFGVLMRSLRDEPRAPH